MLSILEAIALNPQIESSIGALLASIATHLIDHSDQPDAIKKIGHDLIANSGQIVSAVMASTTAAATPAPRATPASPRAG